MAFNDPFDIGAPAFGVGDYVLDERQGAAAASGAIGEASPKFLEMLQDPDAINAFAREMAPIMHMPPDAAYSLASGEAPTDPAYTPDQYREQNAPPTGPAEIVENEANIKNFLGTLRDDPTALRALGQFGAQLAQGAPRDEEGVAGMLGRSLQTGISTLTAGRKAEAGAKIAQEKLGLEKRRTTATESQARTAAVRAGATKKTGGDVGQVEAIAKQFQEFNPEMQKDEATALAWDFFSKRAQLKILYKQRDEMSAFMGEDQKAELGTQIGALEDEMRVPGGVKAPPVVKEGAERFNKQTAPKRGDAGVLDTIFPPEDVGEIEDVPAGQRVSAQATAGKVDRSGGGKKSPADFDASTLFEFYLSVQEGGAPLPGSPLYAQALAKTQEQYPEFQPSGGTP